MTKFDGSDFQAALIHELKNTLGLLSMALERIPLRDEPEHDAAVDAARLLCQGVVDRLHQALLIYKAANHEIRPTIDAWSPHDLVHEMAGQAAELARNRLRVEAEVAEGVPALWFFDRDLVEMAMTNAIHNALAHARSTLRLGAEMTDGCLALCVRDDSAGYPERILADDADGGAYRATGTGLGLQFARLIAESHDNRGRRGALRLGNDGGAVFRLLLP
jgi:signal transduction histidine kinase